MIKKLFGITAITLIANAGLACPDLAGAYSCSDDEGAWTETYTQRVVDGVTRYTVKQSNDEKADEIITDGKSHEADMDDGQKGTYVASCKEDKLLVDLNFDMDGMKMLGKAVLSKKDNKLHKNISIYINGQKLGEEKQVCNGQ